MWGRLSSWRAGAAVCILAATVVAIPARAAAYSVTGFVRNEAGQGIANADLDFIDICTGTNVFVQNDKTSATGAYNVIVNEGTYDIHFTPPVGSTLAAAERSEVSVHSNLNLGVTTMHPGRIVAGTVKNVSGTGLPSVNLDFRDLSTGLKIYVPNDLTSATGTYSVRVRSGTYDIEYRPPSTTTYLTGLREGLVVTGDVTGLVDTLGTGIQVHAKVINQRGVVLQGADLDFFDSCLGTTIPTAHDNTDSTGNVTVYVAAGTYTITVAPPRCSTSLGAYRIPGAQISVTTELGNITLPDAFAVTGRVVDPALQPVPDTDLNFYSVIDCQTETRQGTTRDNSDSLGNFSVYVPAGTYNINFNPPRARDLLVGRVESVEITGAKNLGDIVLSAGFRTSGTVIGPDLTGVRNVDIDAIDTGTRDSLRLIHDTTAEDGTFSVIVPAGTYDYQFEPPACMTLASTEQKDVVVNGALTLPTTQLVQGVHAMGSVLDASSQPVLDVDLDFFPPGTRDDIDTPRDRTDATGTYDVIVPPGTYDIDYVPPAGSTLLLSQKFNVAVTSDTTIPNTILQQGLVVSGFVYDDATGLPVTDVDLDFFPPGGGTELRTPHDNTGCDGDYAVAVPSGTWDIRFTPPSGTGLAPRWARGVVVTSNVILADTFLLPLTVPVVNSISQTSGSTAGGQPVMVSGSGFQPDATLKLGGVSATNVIVVSAATITATTPAHPAGLVDVVVTNPGDQVGTKPQAYTFVEPATPIVLSVAKSGNDVVLTWTPTGQATYTVFRSVDPKPNGWTDDSILIKTSATSYTDPGGLLLVGLQFYSVD